MVRKPGWILSLLLLLGLAIGLGSRLAVAQTAATSTAPAAPSAVQDSTAGQSVNALIDNLKATAERLLELPVYVIFAAVGAVAGALAMLIRRVARNPARAGTAHWLRIGLALLVILSAALLIDRKIDALQSELDLVRAKSSADMLRLVKAISKWETTRQTYLMDPAQAEKNLAATFGGVNVQPMIYNDAADFMQVKTQSPLSAAYLAVVDLRDPAVQIKLGTDLSRKTLTTDFARRTDCVLAINGEAGMTPSMNAPLGEWRGNLVSGGQILLREDPRMPRPYLAFDRANRATFTPATATERTVSAESNNVIWGRWDALLRGQVPSGGPLDRQPRTAMGINKDGTRLFLMVVDGRQPRYSNGFTRAEVGQFLKAFGATDGMLCDEGGSSCIYLKQLGGICNVPSDNQGEERPTYTHFGIALRAGS